MIPLANRLERAVERVKPLNLVVAGLFGGAALCLASFLLQVHSIPLSTPNGPKEVGFLWAWNWSLMLVLMFPALMNAIAK